jgi:hypothetical protein
MENNTELKTHVSEQESDDFIALARLLGFETKSQFLRFIALREIKGVLPQLQNNAPKYGNTGLGKG